MAIQARVRYKPDTFRNGIETTIENKGRDAEGNLTGQFVRIAQLVAWDSSAFSIADYLAGAEASERYLALADQEVVRLDVAAFRGVTWAEAEALWQAELDRLAADWQADKDVLLKGAGGVRLADPVAI